MKQQNIIHCIGDSHVSFFSGNDDMQPMWPEKSHDLIPMFKSYRLGPVLAYNLCREGASAGGREKMFEVLKTLPSGSNVLLCFGEIDCRVHLLKQVRIQNRPLAEIVKECVDRYWSVVREIKSMGFTVLVWVVIASTRDDKIGESDYPTYGSCLERNQTTIMFNDYLCELGITDGVNVISIFDDLLNKDGVTNYGFYVDMLHLSQKVMPLVITKIVDNFSEIKVSLFSNEHLDFLPIVWQWSIFKLKCVWRVGIHKFKVFNNKIMLRNKIKGILRYLISKSKFLTKTKLIIDQYRCHGLPPPRFKQRTVQSYGKRFKTKVLVETGTYLGDMVEATKSNFDKIVSIELDKTLFEKAKARFAFYGHIQILNGDSGAVLPEVLKNINQPILFWLDGHYSGDITAKGDLNTPIIKELEAIFSHPIKNHVILIDDAREFTGTNDYPTLEKLTEHVKRVNPNLRVKVKNDIIRINL